MLKSTILKIYHFIPFKPQLFSFIKLFWTPPKSIYQHLYFKDVFTVKIDDDHQFKMNHFGFELENELFWKGMKGWEAVSFNIWIQLCKEAKVIFDVGANTGVFALIAKAVNKEATVYAFEPVKRVCDKIHENNALNNFDINVVEKAAADYDGKGVIYDPQGEHVYSVTVNMEKSVPDIDFAKVEIETIKLSTFIKNENLPKVDLMKIDVESFEPEVLDGLGDYLKKFKPTIIIEILGDDIGIRVHEIVKDLGYIYFKIEDNSKLVRTESLTNEIVKEDDDHNYLLCSPEVVKSLNF